MLIVRIADNTDYPLFVQNNPIFHDMPPDVDCHSPNAFLDTGHSMEGPTLNTFLDLTTQRGRSTSNKTNVSHRVNNNVRAKHRATACIDFQ